ncbi:MAG: hypothetical protein WA484_08705 [Solirubrobacteraceae bacterium]
MILTSSARAEFGFLPGKAGFNVTMTNADGTPDLQAGSHPFDFTTAFLFNTTVGVAASGKVKMFPDEELKDIAVELPAGFVGNATAMPQCSQRLFHLSPPFGTYDKTSCPASTVVGLEGIGIGIENGEVEFAYVNVYNLVPPVGTPAQFGFNYANIPVTLTPSVRTGRDYGLTVKSDNIPQVLPIYGAITTFWGVPADPRHDGERGHGCLSLEGGSTGNLCPTDTPVVPLLTLPTACSGPLTFGIQGDSWQKSGQWATSSFQSEDGEGNAVGLDGCNQLAFGPSLKVVPNGSAASTPTGLDVNLNVSRETDLNPTGLSQADVKDTTVTLPEGVVLNPSAADGLQACSEEQAGFEGVDQSTGSDLFSPGVVSCPEASKVATVRIKTPLLPNPIEGAVYLAAQESNPFKSLVALYLVAEDPKVGVRIKIAGEVKLDHETGRLLTTFLNTPPLPFEELKLEFFGTDRAPLGTPAFCGTYSTEASIAPWSGNPTVSLLAPFDIATGPAGSACAAPLPFSPALTAGSTNIQAGGLTPFTLTMSREDGNQTLSTIKLHMPPGLLGMLSSVTLCAEEQAAAGLCGPESLIGHTIVSVGLGNDPYSVTGGRVYITGPYKGASYGLSIVNPAKAGPFDLENKTPCDCVVVRGKIEVDPTTAALTVTSDPLPTILDGIPLQIKHVNVTIDRSGFTFNPTNCQPLQLTGTLSSTLGASQGLSVPFQVTNCATLGFEPQFRASTSAKTSRSTGASLAVRLSYPKGAFGSQANIAKVKVDLPRQLPSRLTTLQKACTDKVFSTNPAACPAPSRVGTAMVTTPVLPVPLNGPVYFVSHGSAKFPELIIVLSGYGVTVQLHGETFISKSGVTSTTFRTVPDVPFENFELKLPQGPYSALTNNGSPCKRKLLMPTAMTAQNGLVIHQSTNIAVNGCPKAKKAKARSKAKHDKKK